MEALYSIQNKRLHSSPQKLCYIILLLCFFTNGFTITNRPELYSEAADSCLGYQECQCTATTVYCNGVLQMIAVPKPISTNVIKVDLNNNAIQKIEEDDFAELEFLTTLFLGNNSIDYIHEHAFRNLYRLEILNLEANQLFELDPSGLTFQHLVSLRWLYLQKNWITSVKKYSFFTIGSPHYVASVNLDDNPVQCDCDTWVLKQWEESQPVRRVQINMTCVNDVNGRPYKEAEDSVFGSCDSTQDDFFSHVAECPICVSEGTNYKCNLHGMAECLNNEMVCQKTVAWDDSDKIMLISSKCENNQTCLNNEENNNKTCGLGYQYNGNVVCNFCCRGPTCRNKSIGERTKDFIFYLSYITNSSYEHYMESLYLIQNNKTVAAIESAVSNINGGINLNLYMIIPQEDKQYKVVLLIHVTTFNNVYEDSMKTAMLEGLNKSIANPNNVLHQENLGSLTLSAYLEGLECDNSTDTCPSNLHCIQSQDGTARCLCDDSSFYVAYAQACSPLSELQVLNLCVSSSTNDTVTLNWTAEQHGTNVIYTIQPSPNKGHVEANSVSANGATWSGLDPGTRYSFTVMSALTTDFYIRYVNSSISGVWTKAVHGNFCDPAAKANGNACTGANIVCTNTSGVESHCVCAPGYYFSHNNICRGALELQVKNLTASSSTTDTVILRWTTANHGTSVIYSFQLLPKKGQEVVNPVSASEAKWSRLDPGTQYTFTVISTLPADKLYAEKRISSLATSVWTKFAHGMECNASTYNCATNMSCIGSLDGKTRCLCDNASFFATSAKTCSPLNELQVKNLSVSSVTNDSVTLTWTADKYGTNVGYTVQPSPSKGQVLDNSVSVSGASWIGLDPGTQYNFTVTSNLATDFYKRTINASIFGVLTEIAENVTLYITYIRQNVVHQSFMDDPSSQEYLIEEQRIDVGVKSAFSGTVEIVDLRVFPFFRSIPQQYEVLIKMEVTTFYRETVQRVIIEAVQKNTENPNGFFSKEDVKSLEVSLTLTGSSQCPCSITFADKGVIKWDTADIGLHYAPCPYSNPLDHPAPYASRPCLKNADGLTIWAIWGEVNDSICITKDMQEKAVEEIFERNLTTDNAQIFSSTLKIYTERFDNFTVTMMVKSVKLLEELTTVEMLAQPDVITNVMGCLNNLISVDFETLRKSEMETATSQKLLAVIDSISNKAPLIKDELKQKTHNLAVAAVKVDSSETENLVLIADADSDSRQNVSIDVVTSNNPLLEDRTTMVIPVQAILASLANEEKRKLNRISFTVHRSDILFATIKNNGNGGTPWTATRKHSVGEKLDSSNDYQKENSKIFTTKVNSLVISASVPGVRVQNLSKNITMRFEHINTNATNAQCVFWNESLSSGKGDWSDVGCGIVESYAGGITCGCNHLTNFALLMDVYEEGSSLSDLDRKILSIISYVGCGISSVALILTLITYSLFRRLVRDKPAKILINLCLALLLSNLVFLVGMQDYAFGNIVSCKVVAVLLHYFLLSSLTWMAVEAFYMYLALVLVFNTYYNNFILKCSLVGWGVPLLIVVITLAVNTTDNYGFVNSGLCWLKNPAFYAAFVGPVCFILLINCIAFMLVIKQLVHISGTRLHKSDRNSTIQRLRGAVGVVILLGLSWLFAIFAIDQASVAFYYLFAVFNSLQGLFIFIFYCLLKTDAFGALKRLLPCFEEYGDTTKSYSNSRAVTATADGHRLAEHKSGSAKNNGHTKSTVSTITDSRKDSCFSVTSSNISQDTNDDLPSYSPVESDKPNGQFENPHSNDTYGNTIPETENSDCSEYDSEKCSDSVYCKAALPVDQPFVPTSLNLPQTINYDSVHMQPPHSSSRDIVKQPGNLPCSHQTYGVLNPAFATVAADGEIDCSHIARVHDTRRKFEWSISETSDASDLNATKV